MKGLIEQLLERKTAANTGEPIKPSVYFHSQTLNQSNFSPGTDPGAAGGRRLCMAAGWHFSEETHV